MKRKRTLAILVTLCLLAACLPAEAALALTGRTKEPDLLAFAAAYHDLTAGFDGGGAKKAPAKDGAAQAEEALCPGDETGRLIVKADRRPRSRLAVRTLAAPDGFWILQYESAEAARSEIPALEALDYVTGVEAERIVGACADGSLSWGYEAEHIDMNSYNGWLRGQYEDLPQITVAVVDTGVKYDHPFLAGRVLQDEGYDFANNDADAYDDAYHGTHVAGTVADGTLPNVSILPVKVLSEYGYGTDTEVYLGVKYAVDQNVDVINLSLGGSGVSDYLDAVIAEATAKGIVVCVAAGNNNADAGGFYPACVPAALTVGAIEEDGTRAFFSNYGSCVDIAAPGVAIYSAYPREASQDRLTDYEYLSGTSMATPHVSAAAAMLKSYDTSLDTEGVLDLMRAAAKPLDTDEPLGCGALCMRDIVSTDASAVRLDRLSIRMYPEQTAALGLHNETGAMAVWTSSDAAIASVENGVVTAVSNGTARITATCGDQRRFCDVTVEPLIFTMDETEIDTCVGLPQALPFTLTYDVPIAWTCSEDGIVEVSPKGIILPVSPGEVTVSGTVAEGTASEATRTVRVRVQEIGVWYTGPRQETYVIGSARDLYELSVISRSPIEQHDLSGAVVTIDPAAGPLDMSGFPDFMPIGLPYTLGAYASRETLWDFDGSGVPITGLTIAEGRCGYTSSLRKSGVGLFSETGRQTIRNVRLENASITGLQSVGGICGRAKGSRIENCFVSGSVSALDDVAAGIIAVANYTTVINCENAAEISAAAYKAAGLVGISHYQSKIVNCLNSGPIRSACSAGLVCAASYSGSMHFPYYTYEAHPVTDYHGASLINCVNTGEALSGIAHVVIGIYVTNCYWLSSATRYGIRCVVNANAQYPEMNDPQHYPFDAALTADIDGETRPVVETLNAGAGYYNTLAGSGGACPWTVRNGLPALQTGAQAPERAVFWFGEKEIILPTGAVRTPTLHIWGEPAGLAFTSSAPEVAAVSADGAVTALAEGQTVITAAADGWTARMTVRTVGVSAWYRENAASFVISDGRELWEMAKVVNAGLDDFDGKTVTLANDIDISAYADWTPIGDADTGGYFKGTFDGAGRRIAGLRLTDGAGRRTFGLFGELRGGTVKNLRLTGADLRVPRGVVFGTVCFRTDSASFVTDCAVFGDAEIKPDGQPEDPAGESGPAVSGGIVSENSGELLRCVSGLNFNCRPRAYRAAGQTFRGQDYAGIAGVNNGLVDRCVNRGGIRNDALSCGICGYNRYAIHNCVNYGTIRFHESSDADPDAAGLTGSNRNMVSNCVNFGELRLRQNAGSAGGVAGSIPSERSGQFRFVVNHAPVVGGQGSSALGLATNRIWRNAYWLAGTSAQGLQRESEARGLSNVGPYGSDLKLENGDSLTDVLNGQVEHHNWGTDTFVPWRTDAEGRPNLDLGCTHAKTETFVLSYASCTEDGAELTVCATCGEARSAVRITGHASGHSFAEESVPSTCITKGYDRIRCTRCDYESVEYRDYAGHADLNRDGRCDVCGAAVETPPSEPEQALCPWCHKPHTGPFGGLVAFFHRIFYFFSQLFGR